MLPGDDLSVGTCQMARWSFNFTILDNSWWISRSKKSKSTRHLLQNHYRSHVKHLKRFHWHIWYVSSPFRLWLNCNWPCLFDIISPWACTFKKTFKLKFLLCNVLSWLCEESNGGNSLVLESLDLQQDEMIRLAVGTTSTSFRMEDGNLKQFGKRSGSFHALVCHHET